ncbi:MAG: tetratricopeptide repeat protein [Planctomycetota bacterium]
MKRDGTNHRMTAFAMGAWAVLAVAPLAPAAAVAPTGRAAPVAPPRAAPKDQIFLREAPEKPLEVEVLKETATVVEFKLGPNVQRRYNNEVLRVVFGDTPPAWREALRLLDDGKSEEALAKIEAAAGSKVRASWFEPHSLYAKALAQHALARGGKAGAAEQAEAAYLSYRQKFKDHKFYDESAVRLAELYVEQKKADKAEALVDPSARAKLRGKWPGEASFVMANVFRLKGNRLRALADFEQLLKNTNKKENPELVERTRFEIGISLIENGKAAEAVKHFQSCLAETPKGPQKPPIWAQVGLGEAFLASGQSKAALLAFVEVSVLGFENRSAQARAWYRAGECWEKLGKPDEAKKRFAHCAANYPDTEWGRLSKAKG